MMMQLQEVPFIQLPPVMTFDIIVAKYRNQEIDVVTMCV